MRIQVQKWGNSLAIRIPKSFAKETNIDQGAFLDLSVVEGKLVAVPIPEKEYSLEALLSQITDENKHDEVNIQQVTGKEIW